MGGDRDHFLREWRLLTAALLLLLCALVLGDGLERADLLAYDLAMTTYRRPAADNIVIVAVDDASIAAMGRWPWRRAIHATLLERLTAARAKAVGFDIMLGEADSADPISDVSLARAIAHNRRVVLPVVQVLTGGSRVTAQPPLLMFSQGAAALGQAHSELSADGLVRQVHLAEGVQQPGYAHFALALLQVADSQHFPPFPVGHGPAISWLRQWPLAVAYAGPPGHYQQLSYVDVLRGSVPPETFAGKLVLVGVTASGLGDDSPTPVSGAGRTMAGVELIANVLDTLQRDIVIRPLPLSLALAVPGLMIILLMLGLRRASPRAGLLLTFGLALSLVLLSVLLLRLGQVWFAPMATLVVVSLAYPLWSWRRLEAAQAHLDRELALLAAEPDVFGSSPSVSAAGADPFQRRIDAVRVAAEQQRSTRNFVRDVVSSLPVGVLVADSRMRVVLSNRRAAALLGLVAGKDGVGGNLIRLLGLLKSTENGLFGSQMQSIAAGQTLHAEVVAPTSPAVLLEVVACYGASGRRIGLIATLADIGEMKVMQQSRDDTLHFLSHDLRAPLASILTLLEDAHQGVATAGESDLLARIGRYAKRSLQLADDFLRLARAEALDSQRFVEVDLLAVLAEAADEVWPQARARQIRVISSLDHIELEQGAQVLGDGELLRRAAINLLVNAIKFSPEGGEVSLDVCREDNFWQIRFSDQGQGIAPEQRDRLFARFGRFSTSRAYSEGFGLGLAIVKAVVSAHHGSVEVAGDATHGNCFIVRLPVLDSNDSE